MTADLIELARAGNWEAFGQLVAPYERELLAHCYRMLGSLQDAEDAMQNALLASGRGDPRRHRGVRDQRAQARSCDPAPE